MVLMKKKATSKIVKYMTPGSGVLSLQWDLNYYIVKMHYFSKKSPLLFFKIKYQITSILTKVTKL